MNLGIFCAGSLGREILDIVVNNSCRKNWENVIFIDDVTAETSICGYKVLRSDQFKSEYPADKVEILIGSGEPSCRKILQKKIKSDGFRLATLISDKAFVGSGCTIEPGVIIFPFAYIGHETIIKENTLVHSGANVEARCFVGDNTFLSAGAFVGADTTIGNLAFVGPGSVLRDHISIGNEAIVGMGSVVTASVEENSVVVGNPARPIRDNDDKIIFKNKENSRKGSCI